MSESGSLHAESSTSHETGGTQNTVNTDSTGFQSAPLAIVPAYQHLQKFKSHKETLPELPSHKFQFSVWHNLRNVTLKGTQLKAPRVRDGPPEKEKEFYHLKDEDNEYIHHSLKGKQRIYYEQKMENWQHAQFVSLNYQKLNDRYQQDSFYKILKQIPNVRHLNLVDNGITGLRWYSFPKCEVINLSNNYISSFGCLPSLPSIRSITMEDNDVHCFGGLSRFDSTPLEELNLRGCPITFVINYRQRIFQILPNLKVLDGIPKLNSDCSFEEFYNPSPVGNGCIIL